MLKSSIFCLIFLSTFINVARAAFPLSIFIETGTVEVKWSEEKFIINARAKDGRVFQSLGSDLESTFHLLEPKVRSLITNFADYGPSETLDFSPIIKEILVEYLKTSDSLEFKSEERDIKGHSNFIVTFKGINHHPEQNLQHRGSYLESIFYTLFLSDIEQVLFPNKSYLEITQTKVRQAVADEIPKASISAISEDYLGDFEIETDGNRVLNEISAKLPDSIDVGVVGFQGRRSKMEDQFLVYLPSESPLIEKGIRTFAILGVLDGHGGATIAEEAAKIIPNIIIKYLGRLDKTQILDQEQVSKALIQAFFVEAHKESLEDVRIPTVHQLLKELAEKENLKKQGSTAVIAVILDQVKYLINLGDSRAIQIAENGEGVRLTRDHKIVSPKPERTNYIDEEGLGVFSRGGFVIFNRIDGVLAVTRALGNEDTISIGRVPEVTVTTLNHPIILESDGIHDVLTDHDVAKIVNKAFSDGKTPLQAARNLVATAQNGSRDNMTALIIRFNVDIPQDEVDTKSQSFAQWILNLFA